MKQALLALTLSFLSVNFLPAQPLPTTATDRQEGYQKHQDLAKNSLVKGIKFRSAGPAVFSGRVSDIDVSPHDPSHFYVGYASGGVWKTKNNGITFDPLFDKEMVMSIGDIAVDWDENVVWVGTGEVNSSRSSYSGNGMYKSEDGGVTWAYKGLPESHHIGRVILHPNDPNTLWVAALGHLYSPNPERGIFKTTDGGETWEKTLFVNDNAGAVDLILDPGNPDILYAAAWERTRRAWNFTEAGAGSGIYKSTDGGESWILMTGEGSDFPQGEGAGRIGLDAVIKDGKTILFAAIDNYFRRDEEEDEKKEEGLTKEEIETLSREQFLDVDTAALKVYLEDNNFPKKYTADTVFTLVKDGTIEPSDLVEFLQDANALLFDTPVIGLEVYRSDDNGKSWQRTHEDYIDAVYYSYGYYFGQIRVAPDNPEQLYVMGVPILRSDDGGANWKSIDGDNVHADHHALWINPDRPGHIILGNDGGINISYDAGENWNKCNSPALGQFYAITVDMAKPYRIYGGLQDNGVWMGPSDYRESTRWQGSGQYPYRSIMGGDGMQVAVDTRDNTTVYTGSQFGNYFRLNTETDDRKYITPGHELGEHPLRWNWQTPIHLSIHNQDILYMGSQKVHRSMNNGDNFENISDDLTMGGKKGDVPYGTLTTIHESPLRFGLIYAGSDDGLIHVSKDGGTQWSLISKSPMPEDLWVTTVLASAHEQDRVYASLNGYRWDDFGAYLYVSEDYGETWTSLSGKLPAEPINVVSEDPVNPDILYVGTDHGLYVSLDRGKSFMLMDNELPAVPVHDVVVHPRENELVVGTHGRSIYLANVKQLQMLDEKMLAGDLFVFDIESVRHSSRWGNKRADWSNAFEPEVDIPIYTSTEGEIEIKIMGKDDLLLQTLTKDVPAGLSYLSYDLSIDPSKMEAYQNLLQEGQKEDEDPIELEESDNKKVYLQGGNYTVLILKDGEEMKKTLDIK